MTYLEANMPYFKFLGLQKVSDLVLSRSAQREQLKASVGKLKMSTGDSLKVFFYKFLEIFGCDRTKEINDVAWKYFNDGYNYFTHGQGEDGQSVDLSHIQPLRADGPARKSADKVDEMVNSLASPRFEPSVGSSKAENSSIAQYLDAIGDEDEFASKDEVALNRAKDETTAALKGEKVSNLPPAIDVPKDLTFKI